jgi:hypothetical protein
MEGGEYVTENQYQSKLIRKLKRRFPGCIVLKNDSGYQQGIPDLTILFETTWAMLEVKPSLTANKEPNQEYFVKTADGMSFGAFICPENEEEILDALQEAFESHRRACVS